MDNLDSMIVNAVIATIKDELDFIVTESDFYIQQTKEEYDHNEYIVCSGFNKKLSKYYIEIEYYKKSMDLYIRIYEKICNKTVKILGV